MRKFPGSVIRATPIIPTTTDASGVWDMAQVYQAVGQGIWPNALIVEVTYGTMAEASQGLNGTSIANHGLKFTNLYAGTVTQAQLGKGQAGQNQVAKVYTDNSGSPGTQVGGNSDAVAESGSSDHTFTWSSNAPVLSASTVYWLVTSRSSSTSMVDTCTQVAGQVTGAHATITSITDGSNVTAGRDMRMGITVTP